MRVGSILAGGLSRAAIVLLGIAGCAVTGDDATEPLTWEEFEARTFREPSGVYIVNGDEIAEDLDQLRSYYDAYLDSFYADSAEQDGIGRSQQPLTVNRVCSSGDCDDKWRGSSALSLSYCVDRTSFGPSYSRVVDAMHEAQQDWQEAGRVLFRHDSRTTCDARNVLFTVVKVNFGQYLASAFLPSSHRTNRILRIDADALGDISPFTLAGVVRHEMGHILGFRHEHIRPESLGICPETGSWRTLTSYDSESVMHYPDCGGSNPGDLVLTSRDRQGAASLYPF